MILPLASRRTTVKHLGQLLLSHKGHVALVIFLQFAAAAAAITQPWILGLVIDAIGAGTTSDWLIQMMALAFLLVGVATGATWLATYQARVLGENLFATLRVNLIRSVTRLPLSTVEQAGSGDLLGRATHDVSMVSRLVRDGATMGLQIMVGMSVSVIAVLMTSPILGLVVLAGLPFLVLGIRWYMYRAIPAYRVFVGGIATVSGLVTETIEQGESVDAFRLERIREGRMAAVMTEMMAVDRYGAWMRLYLFICLVLGTLLPLVVVVIVGTALMPYGLTTAGQISAVALMGYQMRGFVWRATFWVDELLTTLVSLQRIFGVDEVPADREATVSHTDATTIRADQVTYAYRDGRPVLHEVDLTLVPGERLAIVGPSGAGKSTFGRMLAGIHPPTSGQVCVGEVPLVALEEEELRSHVVLVTQEHHVFVGTVADNVRLAKASRSGVVDDATIQAALEAVGAWEWIKTLDGGLHARIGAGGYECSPAQAQQLALARIIVMDPHTVVLDEATSLIDAKAARSVEQALGSLLAGRTVVAIAHRLTTARDADRVAVMMDGRIVELGSHDELIAKGGEYARLWATWNQ